MLVAGLIIDPPLADPAPGWLRVEEDRIVERGQGEPPGPVDLGGSDRLITPPFVDAHLHLPQIHAIGYDGLELLDWLDAVIYPAESRWADPEAVRADLRTGLTRLYRSGTFAFAAYLTAHAQGLDLLDAALAELPLHGLAGQVRMDREAPEALLHHPEAPPTPGRSDLRTAVTPRFAPACSDELLAACGRGAAPDAWVQTHLAETVAECEAVATRFPGETYAAVYDRFDLLGPRTLLGHCIHLDEASWALLAARDAVAVHCPTANAFLGAGMFDLAAARRHGVRVGLGSDVAAGADLAMPRVARAMLDTARLRRAMVDPDAAVPTPGEAWHLITRGNASLLGLDDLGRLEPGGEASFLVLDVPFHPDGHLLGRLLYTWSDLYIVGRVLRGRLDHAS